MTRILLADGGADCREMYAAYLRSLGYDVAECRTAADALAAAAASPPGAVVVAVHLQGEVDGVDLVRRLRSLPALSSTPIIVLAGWRGDISPAMAAGCDRCLLLPVIPQALADEIYTLGSPQLLA